MSNRFQLSGRLLMGLLIIGLGVLFLLDNAQLVHAGGVLRYWPVLLLLVGLLKLTGLGLERNVHAGVILLIIGGWFTLGSAHLVPFSMKTAWPLLLVVFGGWLVFRAVMPGESFSGKTLDPSESVRSFAFLAGDVRKLGSRSFRGGEATAFMGGCELDLRDARIPADEPAVLDLLAVMGGIELKVPADWKVTSSVSPVLGGFEDKTSAPAGVPAGHLVLRGFAIMGGVEVKN